MSDTRRITRIAKGKRPRYFSDPAIDKLHAIVLSLVAELSVTRDRLDALERYLEVRGALSREELDAFEPDASAEEERQARRDAYIQRVMRIVEMEIDQIEGRRDHETFEALYRELLSSG